MLMTDQEKEFLTSLIRPSYSVLEYGSGSSTVLLQDLCSKFTSVEHDGTWYKKIKEQLKSSVEYIYAPPDNVNWEQQFDSERRKNPAGDDGTFTDFLTYVTSPLKSENRQFDIILIDGRARVACAFFSTFLLNTKNPDARILIHDFGPNVSHPYLPYRTYYNSVFKFLSVDRYVDTLYGFTIT